MINTVLFDLDGTLADTAGDFVETINILRRRRGYTPFSAEQIIPWVSRGSMAMINATIPIELPPSNKEIVLDEFHAVYEAQNHAKSVIFDGARQMISTLERDGFSWGIVTNKYRKLTLPLLDKLKLSPEIVVCGDDVKIAKPDPSGLLMACNALHSFPETTAYVGDAERDVIAAKKACMTSIIAGWGYIPEWDEVESWQAEKYAETPDRLMRYL